MKDDLVKLRSFVGLTLDRAATALGLTPGTPDRHWAYVRAWLQQESTGRTGWVAHPRRFY
jgi:hypothetical protein